MMNANRVSRSLASSRPAGVGLIGHEPYLPHTALQIYSRSRTNTKVVSVPPSQHRAMAALGQKRPSTGKSDLSVAPSFCHNPYPALSEHLEARSVSTIDTARSQALALGRVETSSCHLCRWLR